VLLADALGLTSVHVNRTIRQLRTEGLIEIENRALTILDVAKLRQAGGFDPHYLHIAAPGAAQDTAIGS
jgi:DNA-binding transcriptional regulator LsrR (DeoR family)